MHRILAALGGLIVGGLIGWGAVAPTWILMVASEGSQDFSQIEALWHQVTVAGSIILGIMAFSAAPILTNRAFQAGAVRGAGHGTLLVAAGSAILSGGEPVRAVWMILSFGLSFVAFGSMIGGVRGWRGRDQ